MARVVREQRPEPGITATWRRAVGIVLVAFAVSLCAWAFAAYLLVKPISVRVDPALAARDAGMAYILHRVPAFRFPLHAPGDTPSRPRASALRISEDGAELGPAHASHAAIRDRGGGAYSHWGSSLYFSSSDGSDPSVNGRAYVIEIFPSIAPIVYPTVLIALIAGLLSIGPAASGHSSVELTRSERRVQFAVDALGYLAIAWLAAMLLMTFARPFDLSSPGFGTPGAPYSDALGPWLEGGLGFLFGMPTAPFLYRPTIGLFWGSILAIGAHTWWIPALFMLFLLATMVVLLNATYPRIEYRQAAVIAMLALCLVADQLLAVTSAASLAVDFPAFVLTTCGTLFVTSGFVSRQGMPVIAGAMLLGCAAAIRGPLIFGGVLLLALLALTADVRERKAFRWGLLAFVVPVVIDAGLQRVLTITNNGIVSLYCLATDPAHTWTSECHLHFSNVKPSVAQVLRQYQSFVFSAQGARLLLDGTTSRLASDMSAIGRAAALVGTAVALLRWRYSGGGASGVAFGLLFLTLGCFATPSAHAVLGPLMLAILLARSWTRRDWLGLGVLSCYAGCTAFIVLLGLVHYDRLAATYSFLLAFGIALSVSGVGAAHSPPLVRPGLLQASSVGGITLLAIMYTAVVWFPSTLQSTFKQHVKGKQAAMKISQDAAIDRSLYYTGDGYAIYTRADELPVGAWRRFSRTRTDATFNESFIHPNEFVD